MDAIVECVAWDDARQGSMNADATRTPRPFFESAAVSLWSAARANPDVERVLVTNTDVPADVEHVLDASGVRIVGQPFDAFAFSRDIPWYLAYYKLCALQRVVGGGEYARVCMLDMDTFVRGPLSGLFNEADGGGVLCYDTHAAWDAPGRAKMRAEFHQLTGGDASHARFWGGELLCGGTAALSQLLAGCGEVKRLMEQRGLFSERGDEFLVFAAGALGLLPQMTPANAYVARCWTGRYYAVPPWERLAVLHLPSEKVYAFPKAYRRLARDGELPQGWFERTCGLRPQKRPFSPAWVASRVTAKVRER